MKKFLAITLTFAMMLTMTGCWNRREPKNLAIVISLIYDYIETEGYIVTVEVRNPSAGSTITGGSSKSNPFITVTGKAKSVSLALRDTTSNLDRTIFGGHNKVRFITENFARRDMIPLLDFISRDHLTDETPFMVVIEGNVPELIYKSKMGLSDIVGNHLEAVEKVQTNTLSQSISKNSLDFTKDFYDECREPVCGRAYLKEMPSDIGSGNALPSDDPTLKKYSLEYEGLAAFKGNKLVGFFNKEEAFAFNIITNNVKSGYYAVPSDTDYTTLVIRKNKCSITPKAENKDGKYKFNFDVEVNLRLSIISESGSSNFGTKEELKVIEDKLNEQVAAQIKDAIEKAQKEFGSDIFGFGKYVHVKQNKIWKNVKENWNDYFSEAEIAVKVKSDITRTAETKKSTRKIKEGL